MYVLDVSGHGVRASLHSVAVCQTLARPAGPGCIVTTTEKGQAKPASPRRVAELLNERRPWDPVRGQYFTIVYAVLNLTTGQLRFVSAGHPGPIVVRGHGEVEVFPSHPPAVGMFPHPEFEETSCDLRPGDRLFLYSDGISETEDLHGHALGREGLGNKLAQHRDVPLGEAVDALFETLEVWRGPTGRPVDDSSLLAVEIPRR